MLRLRTSRSVGFIQPCLPSPTEWPPSGDGWIHVPQWRQAQQTAVKGDDILAASCAWQRSCWGSPIVTAFPRM
jgi:hypothetical protein